MSALRRFAIEVVSPLKPTRRANNGSGYLNSITSPARAEPRRATSAPIALTDYQIEFVSLTIRLSSAVCRESGPWGRFACV